MSPILIAVCLSLISDPGEEKGIDFLQKSNVPPVTPRIPRSAWATKGMAVGWEVRWEGQRNIL